MNPFDTVIIFGAIVAALGGIVLLWDRWPEKKKKKPS